MLFVLHTSLVYSIAQVGRLHTFLSGWKYTILKFMESGGYTPVDLENDIPSTIPVLSVFGEDDKILPRETFEKLSQLSRARAGLCAIGRPSFIFF